MLGKMTKFPEFTTLSKDLGTRETVVWKGVSICLNSTQNCHFQGVFPKRGSNFERRLRSFQRNYHRRASPHEFEGMDNANQDPPDEIAYLVRW